MKLRPRRSYRTVVTVVVVALSVVLAGCSYLHDIYFVNRCGQDVEISLVDAHVGYIYDEWTELPEGEVSNSFGFFVPDSRSRAGHDRFELLVRSAYGEPLSRTELVFDESLLKDDSHYFAEWHVYLVGDDCAPVLPAIATDSGNPGDFIGDWFSPSNGAIVLIGLAATGFILWRVNRASKEQLLSADVSDQARLPRTPWWKKRRVVIWVLAGWCVAAGYIAVMSVVAFLAGEWMPIVWSIPVFVAGLVAVISLVRRTDRDAPTDKQSA